MIKLDHLRFTKTVRVVIIQNDALLTCQSRNEEWHFLPGWKIEFGDNADKTLAREIGKELGSEIKKHRYIGATNQRYLKKCGTSDYLYDLIYHVELVEKPNIQSNEEGIDFHWTKLEDLKHRKIFPLPLKPCLQQWFSDAKVFWISL